MIALCNVMLVDRQLNSAAQLTGCTLCQLWARVRRRAAWQGGFSSKFFVHS